VGAVLAALAAVLGRTEAVLRLGAAA